MGLEGECDLLEAEGPAETSLHVVHFGSVAPGHVAGTMAPNTRDAHEHHVAILDQVAQGGLHARVASSTDAHGGVVQGLEDVLDALLHLVHDLGIERDVKTM